MLTFPVYAYSLLISSCCGFFYSLLFSHIAPFLYEFQNNGKCLADLRGALHCDLKMIPAPRKKKCNPAAASKNRHLCEVAFLSIPFVRCIVILTRYFHHFLTLGVFSAQSLADSCFPVKQGPSAARLHGEEIYRSLTCNNHSRPF